MEYYILLIKQNKNKAKKKPKGKEGKCIDFHESFIHAYSCK